jgi:hypothetical protein
MASEELEKLLIERERARLALGELESTGEIGFEGDIQRYQMRQKYQELDVRCQELWAKEHPKSAPVKVPSMFKERK